MLLGVTIPLIGYTICAILLAVENATRIEFPEFVSENHGYIAGVGFFCQVMSVFSFGIKLTIRNFALCVLLAGLVGLALYELIWAIRTAQMGKYPVVGEVVEYCRNNPVAAVYVDYKEIRVSPENKTFTPPDFRDVYRDQMDRQISQSGELKRFSRMLARKLGFKVKHAVLKQKGWESDGGYSISGSGIYATGHETTRIYYDGYTLTPRK